MPPAAADNNNNKNNNKTQLDNRHVPLVRHGPRVIKAEAMEIGRQGVDRKDIGASPNEFLLADWNAIFEGAERKMMSWFVDGRIELRMQRRQTGQNLTEMKSAKVDSLVLFLLINSG